MEFEMPALGDVPRAILSTIRGSRIHSPGLNSINKLTLGSSYGSHTVASEALGATSVVYSFGIGEDASFDLALMERFDCAVFAYDPTPRSALWVESNIANSRFIFSPVGLAAEGGSLAVVAPSDASHVSFSAPNGRAATSHFPMRRLGDLMQENGHSRIDVLKMDIEGFEYDVLRNMMLETAIRPTQILVEFHHKMFGYSREHTNDAVDLILSKGYKLFHVSPGGHEYSFIL